MTTPSSKQEKEVAKLKCLMKENPCLFLKQKNRAYEWEKQEIGIELLSPQECLPPTFPQFWKIDKTCFRDSA